MVMARLGKWSACGQDLGPNCGVKNIGEWSLTSMQVMEVRSSSGRWRGLEANVPNTELQKLPQQHLGVVTAVFVSAE
jgi:hypothetical protein